MNFLIIEGAVRIADSDENPLVALSVGSTVNPAIQNAENVDPSIPTYLRTELCTLNVVHRDNLDVLKTIVQEAGGKPSLRDLARVCITRAVNVNEGSPSSDLPIAGERVKKATIAPAKTKEGEQVIHTDRSLLSGRAMFKVVSMEIYPAKEVGGISLDDLMADPPPDPKPVGTPDGAENELPF